MADQENESFLSPKAKRVMLTSSAALLVALAGTGTYYWQTQKTETASLETTKSEKNKGKPAKDITLNTDDNQVKDDRDNQPKRRATEISPDNTGDDFALNDDTDSPVYLVDASNPDEPITPINVDSDKIVIPLPEPPEIPKADEPPFPGKPGSDPNDDSVPDLTGDNPNNQEDPATENPVENPNSGQPGENQDQPDDENTPPDSNDGGTVPPGGGDGTIPPGNGNGGTVPPGDGTTPPDNGQQPPKVIKLIAPETLADRIKAESNYNKMFYIQEKRSELTQAEYDSLIEVVVNAATETKTNAYLENGFLSLEELQNIQMLSSLGMENQTIKGFQEELRKDLFATFANNEVQLYLSKKVESVPEEETLEVSNKNEDEHKEKIAKHVIYYLGKYNEKTEKNIDNVDAEKHLEAQNILFNSALEAQNDAEGNTDQLIEALNKYQMLIQYSSEKEEESKANKKKLLIH